MASLPVDGTSGLAGVIPGVLKREPRRVVTTLNSAEVRQRGNKDCS